MTELNRGDLIADRFRVEELLGEGGIARVYKVRHVRLGSVHAVKLLTLIRPSLSDRLLLEGRIQAQLHHPNLVRVTDVVEHDGQPCLVMEYVPGTHLAALLHDGGSMQIDDALRLFAHVLSAVATAHDVGVLHRDLKPANILLARRGDRWIPKVSDFGIAKIATGGLRDGETRAGVQMGTPGYMAPEQIEDSAQVDHRADIFALGAILYEMLCGVRPFQEETTFRTLRATIEGKLVPVRAKLSSCPPAVAATIERCLETEILDRFQDCHAVADALFEDRPELRALVRRMEAEAVSPGLHRPEITTSNGRAAGSSAHPSTLPEPGTPPLIDGSALNAQDAPQPTLAPDEETEETDATEEIDPDRLPAATEDLLAGIAPGSDSGSGPSLVVGLSPASQVVDGASGPAFAIGHIDASAGGLPDVDGDLDDARPPPRRRSAMPLVAGVAVLAMLGVGGWALTRGHSDALPTQEVNDPEPALGEPVDIEPEGEPAVAPADSSPPAAAGAATSPPARASTTDPVAQGPVHDAPPPAEAAPVEVAAAEPAAEEAVAEEAVAEVEPEVPAEEAVAEEAVAEEAVAEEAVAEEAVAEVEPEVPAEGATMAEEAAPVEVVTAPQPPALTGRWAGVANDIPLTIRFVSQDGEHVSGELIFTQGADVQASRFSGTVSAGNNRISFREEGGTGLAFTGVVRGTGMMGTYTGSDQGGALSWSARRQ